jgi:hypothetical protein
MIKGLIDPAIAPLRSPPRSEHDLVISAAKAWVIAFDNLSGMQAWLSNSLCTLATGGGFSVRELFSDSEEVVFDLKRPIIINGIENLLTKNDLADRSVVLYLPAIPKEKRKQERLLWKEFDRVKPLVFGALLDAVSTVLKNIDNVEPPDLPRMADFAQLVIAAEPALHWEKVKFVEVFDRNSRETLSITFEMDIIASTVLRFVTSKKTWEGTATELLEALREFDKDAANNRGFPKQPNRLSDKLSNAAPSLRLEGVEVNRVTRRSRKIWKLQLVKN